MNIFSLDSGQINYKNTNYNTGMIEWPVNTNCESVHVTSKLFNATHEIFPNGKYHPGEELIIDGTYYFGGQTVNQIVHTNFMVHFQSYTGKHVEFTIGWSCTEWAEWSDSLFNACLQERRPITNGNNTVGHIKFRTRNHCRMSINTFQTW